MDIFTLLSERDSLRMLSALMETEQARRDLERAARQMEARATREESERPGFDPGF